MQWIANAAMLASLLAGEAPAPCTPLDMAQVAHVWHKLEAWR